MENAFESYFIQTNRIRQNEGCINDPEVAIYDVMWGKPGSQVPRTKQCPP